MSDIDTGDVIKILGLVADIYYSYQTYNEIDNLKLEEAKELAEKIWPKLTEIHKQNREL